MSLHLFFSGPPEAIAKVAITPMAPLRSALELAISKMGQVRPPLDASACYLMLHEGGGRGGAKPVSRALDLDCPLRHANIGPTARIEVLRSLPLSAPSSVSSKPNVSELRSEKPQQARQEPTVISPIDHSIAASSNLPSTENDPGAQAWQSLGLDRPIAVFTKESLAEIKANLTNSQRADEADDFFDLTPEDLAIMRHAQEAKRKEEAVLKTRVLREADEAKKAAQFGSVPLRIHFPSPTHGAVIVQAAFSPLEPISTVKQLVSKLLHPSIGSAFQLFTTPPRVILKDMDLSLLKAQLVPAANVHFTLSLGISFLESSYLRDEVMSLLLQTLDLNDTLPGQGSSNRNRQALDQPGPNELTDMAGSSSIPAPEQKLEGGGPVRYLGGAKLPKWMKL